MLVGYASSSDEEDDDEEERNVTAAAATESANSDGVPEIERRKLLQPDGDHRPKSMGDSASAAPKHQQKEKKKGKKKRGRVALPLLEEPPDVESSEDSEQDAAGSDLEGYSDEEKRRSKNKKNKKKESALLDSSSLWQVGDVDHLVDKNLAGSDASLSVGPSLPSISAAVVDSVQSHVAGQEDEENGEDFRAIENRLQELLAQGKSVDELGLASGSIVHMRGQDIKRDALRLRAKAQEEEEQARLVHANISGTAVIDRRAVSSSMKRKNQLLATAFASQEAELDFSAKRAKT